VNRFAKLWLLACGVLLLAAAPALAADEGSGAGVAGLFSKYFGTALIVIGASYGISKLASSAYESMARQPEVAGNIQTAMIIAAALIEGFTFFALLICMLF
jgi:F-type H+-transporting ATPase subunit c